MEAVLDCLPLGCRVGGVPARPLMMRAGKTVANEEENY